MTDCVMYLIKCQNFYKVGISSSVESRIKTMTTGNPFDLIPVASFEFDSKYAAKDAEKYAHIKLKDLGFHKKLEWFEGSENEITDVLTDASLWAIDLHTNKGKEILEKARNLILLIGDDCLSKISGVDIERLINFRDNGEKIYHHEAHKILKAVRSLT